MWPLVQSEDACTFHPIQAVTAKGGKFSIQKEASEIEVGDIVFCQVQPSQLFYAHIVHKVERIYVPIGRSTRSGTFRGTSTADVTGSTSSASSLVCRCVGQYYSRPHPKKLFEKVSALVKDDRWNDTARDLCLPLREAPPSRAAGL